MARRKSANEAIVQPLGKTSPSPHSRIDWVTQRRASAVEVRRYSRFVIVMKRALPMAAFVLIAAVVAYSLVPRQANQAKIEFVFKELGISGGDLAMLEPKLSGTDSSGDPFVVTAAKATQFEHDPDRAMLQNVEGDLTLKDGNWLNATSPRGLLDISRSQDPHCTKITCPSKQTLDMFGPVAVFSDNGYEVHTMFAHVDMSAGVAKGNRYVRGQGPLGTFSADSFVFEFQGNEPVPHPGAKSKIVRKKPVDTGRKIFLYGNVHMTIFGHGMKQS